MVSALSGGERARLLLLRLMLSKANFLLLDEPTNHLDIRSCEALEDALLHYDGTLFIVSHDRYLINKLADRIYSLEPEGVTETIGNYDDYLAHRKAQQQAAEKAAPVAPKVTRDLVCEKNWLLNCERLAPPFPALNRKPKRTTRRCKPLPSRCRNPKLPAILKKPWSFLQKWSS